jgi:ribosomal protein L40E
VTGKMTHKLVCWKCGADIGALPQPLSRRAECLECHGELHVCRMCRHFDPAKAKQCREPMAEEVVDKSKANHCDWFQAKANAYVAADKRKSEDARKALGALFDDDGTDTPTTGADTALDRLFGK